MGTNGSKNALAVCRRNKSQGQGCPSSMPICFGQCPGPSAAKPTDIGPATEGGAKDDLDSSGRRSELAGDCGKNVAKGLADTMDVADLVHTFEIR